MKNINDVIEMVKADHLKLNNGDLSAGKANVMSRNYATVCRMYADKLKHDKHYGINNKISFYNGN